MDADQVRDSTTLLDAANRAIEAGSDIMHKRSAAHMERTSKGDRDFVTRSDLLVEQRVKEILSEAAPGIGFFGEEGGGPEVDQDRLWMVDPIDGTVNFYKGLPLCGIQIALLCDGEPQLALIDLPFMQERYSAILGAGAFLNGVRLAVSDTVEIFDAAIGFGDFTVGADAAERNRNEFRVLEACAQRALRVRMLGSAALDLAWVAAGRLDASITLVNKAWDVSAGALLVREAGGHMYDSDGSPHTLRSVCVLASNSHLMRSIQNIVSSTHDGHAASSF